MNVLKVKTPVQELESLVEHFYRQIRWHRIINYQGILWRMLDHVPSRFHVADDHVLFDDFFGSVTGFD
jgi:hypothetical protein